MAKVRQVERGDYDALARFMAAWPGDRRGLEFWRRRLDFWWEDNPAMGPDEPRGWLVDDDGKVGGFVGNIPTFMEADGQTLTAMNATGWKVEEAHRKHSLMLWLAYMAAAKNRLMLCTTPNDLALEILQGLKFRPTGVGQTRRVVNLGFRRPLELRLGAGPHTRLMAGGLGLVRRMELAARGRRGGRPRGWTSRVIALPGGEVDALWQRTKGQSRLTNRRDADSLAWYASGHPGLAKTVTGAWRGGELMGVAVWRPVGEAGDRGLELMDMWWDWSQDQAPAALAWGGLDLARRDGYDVLILPLYHPALAQGLAGLGKERGGDLRHLFLARGGLAETITDGQAFLTGAQGDAGL